MRGCKVAVLHLPRRLCAQKVCLQCVTDTVLWKKLYHFPPAVLDLQLPCTHNLCRNTYEVVNTICQGYAFTIRASEMKKRFTLRWIICSAILILWKRSWKVWEECCNHLNSTIRSSTLGLSFLECKKKKKKICQFITEISCYCARRIWATKAKAGNVGLAGVKGS